MEKKASLATATDWRAEIKGEIRMKIVHSICAKLKEQWSVNCPDATKLQKITNLAMEHEKNLFNTAKSKDQYFSALTRKMSRSENRHESSTSQVRPALSSDQSVVLIKNAAFVSQPSPQMTNQPHQRAMPNPRYQQPAVPNSLLQQPIQHFTPQPHEQQLHRQKLNVRQPHQQIVMYNQSCVSPQNTLNLPCQPQDFQGRAFGTHMPSEMFTQHPQVVNLQPNERLTAQVKEEVISEDLQASTFSHQHHTAIAQHKQHQSMEVSAVSNGKPNAEDWLDHGFSEMQRLKVHLPVLKKAFFKTSEQCRQLRHAEQIQTCQHHMKLLHNMIIFLEFPRDRIITYSKEKFYRCLQTIVKCLKAIEDCNTNLANMLQQSLPGQPGLIQSRINPVQQSDNVNPHLQPVNVATTGFSDGSPIVPREIGFLSSQADLIRKNMLQNRQHSENIKQECHSSWIQQKQKPTENIQATNRSGMSSGNHLNSKFSPQTHEPSQPSQIAERALRKNPCASLCGRAPPTPSPSTVGLGKSSSNVSNLSSPNFQYPQASNSLELLNTKAEIQVQSHEIRSSSTMTSQLAEPIDLENNGKLSTATQPSNRLLKAVESISNEALRAAVSDISSVGNMEDIITEPWCHETATCLGLLQDGCGSSNNMKRKINATITLNDVPSPCSDIDGSEPAVTSSSKKLKRLSDNALLEEMRNINKQFVETVLEIDSDDENINRRLANAGTVLRCSYIAATESKNSMFQSANTLKLPVLSVKLLVPRYYPEDYPVFLSKFNTDCSTEDEESREMSSEATSMLRSFLRTAPEFLSLEDYARAWDECARAVVSAHAQRAGGGCFSSQYGTWEDCVAAT